MKKNSLAIIIVSKDREQKLSECLDSILKSNLLPDEIVIVNKGAKPLLLKQLKQSKVRISIVTESNSNLSKGRNSGVQVATADIICFTDDDCLVSKDWSANIVSSFREHPKCSGVFGQVFAHELTKQLDSFCPCTFLKQSPEMISLPCPHMKKIGYGNNMAFRASIFQELGFFKPWLSIGSVGKSAEDAEFALRILIHNKKIFFNPKVIVFHNRWLSKLQLKKQSLSYSCGETACYGYFAFQNYKFANQVLQDAFLDSAYQFKLIAKNILKLKINNFLFIDLYYFIANLFFRLKGLLIGLYYSFIDPIR